LNERHLLRLLRDYVSYHHQDRVHDSLGKDTPAGRPIERKPKAEATVISLPRLGGLRHRYAWREAGITNLGRRMLEQGTNLVSNSLPKAIIVVLPARCHRSSRR